jgi:hypothetical protein
MSRMLGISSKPPRKRLIAAVPPLDEPVKNICVPMHSIVAWPAEEEPKKSISPKGLPVIILALAAVDWSKKARKPSSPVKMVALPAVELSWKAIEFLIPEG